MCARRRPTNSLDFRVGLCAHFPTVSEKIQFRVGPDLAHKLREHAKQAGYSPSSYARVLLEEALGNDAKLAAVDEVVWVVQARLAKARERINDDLAKSLQRHLLGVTDDDD